MAILVSTVTAASLASGCTLPERPPPDAGVAGPEWQTVVRYGRGVSSAIAQARLTDIAVVGNQGYDRLVVRFEGNRPGYRVAYDGDDPSTLTVTLHDARDSAARPTADLPAIREVHPSSTEDGDVVAALKLSAAHLPFRVGLSIGTFYVDVVRPSRP